jgi:hypothetical protein
MVIIMVKQSFNSRLLFALVLVCGIAFAQDSEKKASESQKIENYLKSLKEARIDQIKLRLDVSDERANAIATKWAEHEAPIRRINIEGMSVWRQMQFIIQEATPEKEKSRKIKPLFDQYTTLRKELSQSRLRLYQELPTMGDSPIQQARILFLMEEMERKERDGLKAHMEKRKQGGE